MTTPVYLSSEQQAAVNNFRAVVKRQLRPMSGIDPRLVADYVLQYVPLMRAAALAREALDYLMTARELLSSNDGLYRRLTLEMAATMDILSDLQDEAEPRYRQALTLYAQHEPTSADFALAYAAYGDYLLRHHQEPAGAAAYNKALDLATNHPEAAAKIAAGMGRALMEKGQFEKAISFFERAVTALRQLDAAQTLAEVYADYALALIQVGRLGQADELLEKAFDTSQALGLMALRAKVLRQRAYLNQTRAEATEQDSAKRDYQRRAEDALHEAISILVTLPETNELAVAYHDLGRYQAQQKQLDDAEAHVRMSCELFSRIGNRRNFAVSQITLAQILMLKNGNIVGAVERVRQALKIAAEIGDGFTQRQAAESLVRIHRIQAKRSPDMFEETQQQIMHSRHIFEVLRLGEYVSQLDAVLRALGTA